MFTVHMVQHPFAVIYEMNSDILAQEDREARDHILFQDKKMIHEIQLETSECVYSDMCIFYEKVYPCTLPMS